jgi:hypothetical protein
MFGALWLFGALRLVGALRLFDPLRLVDPLRRSPSRMSITETSSRAAAVAARRPGAELPAPLVATAPRTTPRSSRRSVWSRCRPGGADQRRWVRRR